MMLALIAIGGLSHGRSCLTPSRWRPAPRNRSAPAHVAALAVSQFNCKIKQRLRDFPGIPRGAARTSSAGARRTEPIAELEIYRPGGELNQSGPAIADIAARNGRRRHA